MSTETEKLKLFKWDTSNEIDLESDFDIEKTLNENWDKIDDNTEQVSKKNIEQDNSISELQEEIENLRNISNIMPSVNSQGENITLNNTAKNVRFRKFKVGGNVKQEQAVLQKRKRKISVKSVDGKQDYFSGSGNPGRKHFHAKSLYLL